jgi:DNA-damage-inducible protein J
MRTSSEAKTDFIRARIEPKLKAEVESLFDSWGISTTQAIHIFYKQIQRTKGLPFEFAKPNAETEKAIQEAKQGKGIVKCKNEKELFEKLGF